MHKHNFEKTYSVTYTTHKCLKKAFGNYNEKLQIPHLSFLLSFGVWEFSGMSLPIRFLNMTENLEWILQYKEKAAQRNASGKAGRKDGVPRWKKRLLKYYLF